MPKPVDVLWCVEHVARELDLASAVAALLRRRGIDVAIESLLYDRDQLSRKYAPRIVATPYFYSAHDLGVRDLVTSMPSCIFLNLAFEQLFSVGNMRFKRPRDRVAQEHVTHLSSGPDFSRFLSDCGVAPAHQATTGSLPMGMYRRPYQDFFSGHRERFAQQFSLAPDLPWIFFPENFGAAFFSNRKIRERVAQGCDEAEVLAYRSHSQRTMAETMQWCAELAATGTAEVIVRPRPATSLNRFREAVHDVLGSLPAKHLHFIKDSTVRHWVLAADTTVSTFSSTVVEAAVAGRPASLLIPEPLPPSMHCPWHDHADPVTNLDDFMQLPRRTWDPVRDGQLAAWSSHHLLGPGDPVMATADTIAALLDGTREAPRLPRQSTGRQTAGMARLRVRHMIRKVSRRIRGRQRGGGTPYDYFTGDQAQQLIDRWDAMLSDQPARRAV